MNESVIIQKLIQVGQMLERGKLEYGGAEADIKYYLEQYAALRQPLVISSVCDCERSKDIYTVEVYKCGKCHLKVRT